MATNDILKKPALRAGFFIVATRDAGWNWFKATLIVASSRLAQRHRREIHRHRERHVDVVGEQVEGDMGHDFDDGFVVETGVAHRLHVGVADLAAGVDQLEREVQRGLGPGVGRMPRLRGLQGFGADAGIAAEGSVRGQAVVAGVAVGDGHGDLFAQRGRDHAAAEGAERAPHALQRGRGVGDGAEHVGRGAEGAVDGVEQLLALGGGGVAVDQGDAVHGGVPFWGGVEAKLQVAGDGRRVERHASRLG